MKKFHKNALTGFALSVSAVALFAGAPVYAQDADQDCELDAAGNPDEDCEEDSVLQESADGSHTEGAIVVTGSRRRTDTTSSISPLQILTTEAERDAGVFDAAQILQRSEAASGTQIDATFQGFVLDNGPGSQTLNLRGLGADRTLLLINGRRLAPAGVEGAPSSPSINLLPTSLIARYDLLLDGASSVYGSDAVAGVGNIVLRNDLDGLELFASGSINPGGAGEDYTVSGAWGTQFEGGFIGIGAEYSFRDAVRLRDRDFLSGCDTNYEIDSNGDIRTIGVADNAAVQNRSPGVSVSESACKITGISGRIFIPFTRVGSVYFPANGNIANIPGLGYGDSTNRLGANIDTNGDGVRDVDFQNVNTNAANIDRTFISQQKLYNVMAYGEYNLGTDLNITPFFEALYSRAEIFSDNTGNPQIFPSVPDSNLFNPCNFSTGTGVDCRAADNAFQVLTGAAGGLSTGFDLPVSPITSIRGDRNNTDVTQEMYRGVFGIRADLPFIGDSWTYESAVTYSRSEGFSTRSGIREDRLAFAIGLDPTADYDGDGVIDNNGDGIADDYNSGLDFFFGDPQVIDACDASQLANPSLAAPDLNAGACVPVNLFAPSVLTGAIGDFASQAERDYVFGTRNFDTTYEQIVASTYITGEVFELPAGPVSIVLGGEYRYDSIESVPDIVASNGLFFGFFSDLGAVGNKYLIEGFGEVNIPVFSDEFWGDFELNGAGRVTREEFYGTEATYSLGAGWRPIEQVLLKATYGTSYRAPNLRENFLAGQSGFLTLFDPCAVPNDAFVNGAYSAALDQREPVVLQNCVREGRDPTTVGIDAQGLNTVQTSSVEITSGGSLDLRAETSTSFTAGVGVEDSFASGFSYAFNLNYYDIQVSDSIIEPSSQFIINDCYTRDDGVRSPFCDRITEGVQDRRLISDVAAGFINLNREAVRGLDINATLGYDLPMGGDVLELGVNLRANHLIERSELFVDDTGVPTLDEDQGEFGFPSWTGRATFSADYSNFGFTWQTRWIGEMVQQLDGVDPLSDAFGRGPDGAPTGFIGDTCLGNGSGTYNAGTGVFTPNGNVPGDGVFCRDVGFADHYFVHTASIRYRMDDFLTLRLGVSNIFDDAPPLIDTNEVFGISNTPIGNGYDLDGREIFASVNIRF